MSGIRVSLRDLPNVNTACSVKVECVYLVNGVCDEPRINKGNAVCHKMNNKDLLPLLAV